MTILLIGTGFFGFVLGLFYMKDRLKSPMLARIAHSELVMRFAVIGAAMIVIGALLALDRLFA